MSVRMGQVSEDASYVVLDQSFTYTFTDKGVPKMTVVLSDCFDIQIIDCARMLLGESLEVKHKRCAPSALDLNTEGGKKCMKSLTWQENPEFLLAKFLDVNVWDLLRVIACT